MKAIRKWLDAQAETWATSKQKPKIAEQLRTTVTWAKASLYNGDVFRFVLFDSKPFRVKVFNGLV